MIDLVAQILKEKQNSVVVEEKPADSYFLSEIAEKLDADLDEISEVVSKLIKEGKAETISFVEKLTEDKSPLPITKTVVRLKK